MRLTRIPLAAAPIPAPQIGAYVFRSFLFCAKFSSGLLFQIIGNRRHRGSFPGPTPPSSGCIGWSMFGGSSVLPRKYLDPRDDQHAIANGDCIHAPHEVCFSALPSTAVFARLNPAAIASIAAPCQRPAPESYAESHRYAQLISPER
jgi:hypothetical protein